MHVIGTAGHVDHGKSTLVHALTGIDPDRLAEEKAREMTIDLGFAWLSLRGHEVGVVDVPGHRDFIENMLAGVGGIDLALLVVAADEGIMPQTREHLAILDLLEVRRGIVALTKSDLVEDPDWLELVTLEVHDTLRGTALDGSPVIPVSAHTGAGLDVLKEALADALQETGERPDLGRPYLPIDRVFSISGFGTIVTGTLMDGSLRVGDEIEIQPANMPGRIRGLQTHKSKREIVYPGSRVAVNLSNIDRENLHRGQVLAGRGVVRGSRLIDAYYRHLPDVDTPLLHNTEVKLFIGSAETSARVRIIGTENIPAGQEGWIQLALSSPVAAVRGLRFILRRPSPGATLGGGRVLDPHPGRRHRRFRADVIERFKTLTQGTPDEIIMAALVASGTLSPAALGEKTGLPAQAVQESLRRLIEDGQAINLEKVVISASEWRSLLERVPSELANFHREAPMRPGMDREDLRGRLRVTPVVFNPLKETLLKSGVIAESGTLLRLPGHEVTFSTEQQRSIDQLMALFDRQGVLSPSVKECKAIVGESTYFALVDAEQIKPISEEVVYSIGIYRQLIAQLMDYLYAKGSISAPETRDLLNTSRKYAIALLEHMDELRITRRTGDTRIPTRPQTLPK